MSYSVSIGLLVSWSWALAELLWCCVAGELKVSVSMSVSVSVTGSGSGCFKIGVCVGVDFGVSDVWSLS